MSRSYKHYPCVKDKSCSRSGKKFANRSIRRMKNVPNGGGYKKLKESYDICDWAFYETYKDYKRWYNRSLNMDMLLGREPDIKTEKELFYEWFRTYKRK